MNFDDLDAKMRSYEQSLEQVLAPDLYMVARLDGRRFTRLTKELCKFEVPFDVKFRDMMVETVKALMDCGFRVVYGFAESDEISLLFHADENTFGRRVRKYNSTLAGVASAAFSLQLGQQAVFDCRMVPLPSIECVRDYFMWRQEDAHRNALNAHCYWLLRKEGASVQEATKQLDGKSASFKNELLVKHSISFDNLPNWQKRGLGVWWSDIVKEGYNPVTRQIVQTTRRGLHVEYDLPLRKEYAQLVTNFIEIDK